MIATPRTVERLLEGLGADAAFREGVLGDLAEEFALRAERDGAPAARRWYYRESIRTAPHLLRHCARSLHRRDVVHVANVVLASYVLAGLLAFFVSMTMRSVFGALGVSLPVIPPDGLAPAVELTLGAISALLGGGVAAWLDKRTPLVSAFALGVVWSVAGMVVSAFVGASVPGWYRVCASLVLVSGTTIGAMLHIHTTRFASHEEAPTHSVGQ